MWVKCLEGEVRSTVIGAQMMANYPKSLSSQHVCQEHDVADGKYDAAQEPKISSVATIGPFETHFLFTASYAALRRPELSCSLITLL